MNPEPTTRNLRNKYIVDFTNTFSDPYIANILDISTVAEGKNLKEGDVASPAERKHESGWTIRTNVVEQDYFVWVGDFEAVHSQYGAISGNFSQIVTAESKEAYDHFHKHHPFDKFDLGNI